MSVNESCGISARIDMWRTLWRTSWTDRLVVDAPRVDDAPVQQREGEGRGARRKDRPGGDRLHLVLLLSTRGGMASPLRRDVPRGVEQAVPRSWLRRAARGGTRSDARRSRANEPHRERGHARDTTRQSRAARGPLGGELATLATPAGRRVKGSALAASFLV